MSQTENNLKVLRKELGRGSILGFAKAYFPEYTKSPYCSFHEWICDYLLKSSDRRGSRLAVAAPRNHAKSTIVNLFYIMWAICYGKEKYILILSATARQTQTLLSDIANALMTNTKLLEDFSDIFGADDDVKRKWTQQEIVTKNNIKVSALGWEQELRSTRHREDRPTLIILDDIDGETNTYSETTRGDLYNRFIRSVLKAGTKKTNMIAIGTLLHPDSLLSRLTRQQEFPDWDKKIFKAVIRFSERKDLWDKWKNILYAMDSFEEETGYKAADRFFEANKQEMLKGTEVLWPEAEDYYKLMKIKEIEGSYSFDSEVQNEPVRTEDCRFNPDKFSYWDKEYSDPQKLLASFGDDYSIIGACDPSIGDKRDSNDPAYTAIVILAKHKGRLYVLKADIKYMSQDDIAQAVINYCKIYSRMEKFIIEGNLLPHLLVQFIQERAYAENIIIPLVEIRSTKNKELRIFGIETFITNNIIIFNRSDQLLLEQLKYFPRSRHKDGPDALEIAVSEAKKEGTPFVDITPRKDKHGRSIDDQDYGRSTPEEDAKDEDDLPPPTTGGVAVDK